MYVEKKPDWISRVFNSVWNRNHQITGSLDFWPFFTFSRYQGLQYQEFFLDCDHFSGPEIPESGFSRNFQTLVFKMSPLPAVVVVAEGSPVVVVADGSVVVVAEGSAVVVVTDGSAVVVVAEESVVVVADGSEENLN